MIRLLLHVQTFSDLLKCNSFMEVKSNMKIPQAVLDFPRYPKLECRCWKVCYYLCRKTPGFTLDVTFYSLHFTRNLYDL